MHRHSPALTVFFASVGHAMIHLLTAFYFVLALGLERAWDLPYHDLVGLWTLGALLVGVGAIPAGWLADRWSAPGMLVVMFLGMGAACLWCAFAAGTGGVFAGLSLLGVFAAIYHPVGIPWIVRSTTASGKALGFNGIFGNFGVAAAGIATGLLVDTLGWRAAFAVPGLVSIIVGLAMFASMRAGLVGEGEAAARPARGVVSGQLRSFAVLLFCMFCAGFIYQASQTAFPKVFDMRLGERLGAGTFGVGAVISIVYTVAGLMQLAGGHLADRYPLKPVYLGAFLIQVPVLVWLGTSAGLPLILSATLAVMLGTGALPAENLLLARFAPPGRHGVAFGAKFVLSFGTAPVAIAWVSWVQKASGEFGWVFGSLAALAAGACVAILFLPRAQFDEVESAPT